MVATGKPETVRNNLEFTNLHALFSRIDSGTRSTMSESNHLHHQTQSTQSIADYLAQLLKDRKQLAAFPNVFAHVERLLDEGRNYFCVFPEWML